MANEATPTVVEVTVETPAPTETPPVETLGTNPDTEPTTPVGELMTLSQQVGQLQVAVATLSQQMQETQMTAQNAETSANLALSSSLTTTETEPEEVETEAVTEIAPITESNSQPSEPSESTPAERTDAAPRGNRGFLRTLIFGKE